MKKENFIPLEKGKVKMYSCGPTVYNLIHVGNARPIIVFDVLRRYLEYRGNVVTFAQNFTDIDDKIIVRAAQDSVSAAEIAERFINEYRRDADSLGVRPATIHPKATENIDSIIALISTLVEKGLAYVSGGDVYYRTLKFEGYGKLSRQPLDELVAGARVSTSEIKENPLDFALWKNAKPGEPSWSSPWGDGRPGWHIECSAMVRTHLGETIDIHCGGRDLIFPHHENEIAQSEGACGCQFARYWLHNGFINVDNEKMAKSKGNFFTVRDAAEKYGFKSIRMFMLMSHYRSPLNYSGDILLSAQNAFTRLETAKETLTFLNQNGADILQESESKFIDDLPDYRQRYIDALDDDFNTADAISVIFELVRACNTLAAEKSASKAFAKAALDMLMELSDVLGLFYNDGTETEGGAGSEIEQLIQQRQEARREKNWQKSDEIRNQLSAMGISLEDTPQGVKWKRV